MDVPLDISALLVEDLHARLDVGEVLVPAAGVDDEVYVLVIDLGDDGIVDGAAILVGEDGERAGTVRGGVDGTAAVARKRRGGSLRAASRPGTAPCPETARRPGMAWRCADGAVAGDGAAMARTAARDGERRRTGTERRRGRGPGMGSGGGGPPRRRG